MAFVTKDQRLSDVLHFEGEKGYSRKAITVLSGASVIKSGTVVGKVTASGKYVEYDNDAVDGSEVADGILVSDADVTGGDVAGVIVFQFAMAKLNGLVWGAAVTTQAEKDAAIADFEAKSMPIRVLTDV